MLLTWGQGGGLNAGLSLWLPFNDLGSGAVDTSAATAAGSGTPTFTRATTATTFDVAGTAPISVASGTARSYYNPVSHVYLGYLAEEARTNVLLNSKIDGTNLSTQSVTVSAQAYTLSFYGTGTVTLSGTATGAKVGTGAYPTRSSFTFTPTAGTLTLTVAGTVQYANLEAGSFATSFIPTAGTSVTRNADVLTYPSSGNVVTLSPYTAYAEAIIQGNANNNQNMLGSNQNFNLYLPLQTSVPRAAFFNNDGGAMASIAKTVSAMQTSGKYAARMDGTNIDVFVDGVKGTGAAKGTQVSEITTIHVGSHAGTQQLNGTIKNVKLYSRALTDSQLVSLTA